jgi:nitrite reductase/ring-hydroxylating ferredoxin subunit
MMLVEIDFASKMDDGEMRELKIGEGKMNKVLITKYNGKLRAMGAFCTHFAAPLVNGVMFDDKVMCPYHSAGYNVETGALSQAPGFDGLKTYEIANVDGKYYVSVPETGIKK